MPKHTHTQKKRYHASDMILHVDSNASYLYISKSRSRFGGSHYLISSSKNPNLSPTKTPPINGTLHAVCNILRNVMVSAAESEVGGLFLNGQKATILGTTLEKLNNPQQPTYFKQKTPPHQEYQIKHSASTNESQRICDFIG